MHLAGVDVYYELLKLNLAYPCSESGRFSVFKIVYPVMSRRAIEEENLWLKLIFNYKELTDNDLIIIIV